MLPSRFDSFGHLEEVMTTPAPELVAALGRCSRRHPIDMRYGVLHDIARKLMAREPIDLAMGHASVIWQGDAND
jgi:hypothetical protein